MSFIRLSSSRRGLTGFPAEFKILGRDDTGDVFAVDDSGKVWSFLHGAGNWESRTPAFAEEAQMKAFVAFQDELELPVESESIDQIRARVKRIKSFRREQKGAPWARDAIDSSLEDLKERIAELRSSKSKRGRSLAERQAVAQQCRSALEEAGAGVDWLVGPHVDKTDALLVVGPFLEPWTESAVLDLLQPVAGDYRLIPYRQG